MVVAHKELDKAVDAYIKSLHSGAPFQIAAGAYLTDDIVLLRARIVTLACNFVAECRKAKSKMKP